MQVCLEEKAAWEYISTIGAKMAYEFLLIENIGHVQIVSISRPQVLNALNKKVLEELRLALSVLEQNEHFRCLIITGDKEKSFIAGADLNEMSSFTSLEAEAFSKLGQSVFKMISFLRIPVIAAVNGFALGGGLELALAADFVYASENAIFGLPETKLGLIPGFGGIARLSDRVGIAYAKEMIFSGAQINAAEALRIGLVNRITPQGEVVDAAKLCAENIVQNGPYSVRLSKSILGQVKNFDIDTVNVLESLGFGLVFSSHDHKEGIASFLKKRNASFKGG